MNKIWIISQQRTGSGYLCELLNNLNLFEDKFSEWFYIPKEKFVEEEEFSIEDVVSCCPSKNLPKFCKIHLETMEFMFGDFNSLKNFLGENSKFIYIYRKNVLDQIASRYISILTNRWRVTNQSEHNEFLHKKIKMNKKILIKCIDYVSKMNQKNDYYIKKINLFNINYENLVGNEFSSIEKILSFLEIDFNFDQIINSIKNTNKIIIKQEHPQKSEVIDFIKENKNHIKIKSFL
jgi:LPS sulfotransferase NodH